MSLSISLSPTPGFCVKSKTLTPVPTKVFINIAWDKNVPSPPKSSEDDIQRAMHGDDDERGNPWYVPVVVSEPRQDEDKGKPPFNSPIISQKLSLVHIQPVIRHSSLTASITPPLDHALSAIQISSPFWSVSIVPITPPGTASYLHTYTHRTGDPANRSPV